MTIADWLMIVAVLAAPVLAVQVQKHLEYLREQRGRKVHLFQTLMATRGARLSPVHVQALNMIDIEFYGARAFGLNSKRSGSDQAVLDAWKTYHDHLGESVAPEQMNDWGRKKEDLFIEMLHCMANAVGYHFDKVQLRKGIYTPRGHGELEVDQQVIRESLVSILSGKKAVPIMVASYPALEDALKSAQAAALHAPAQKEGEG
jgi:hypothetical protein